MDYESEISALKTKLAETQDLLSSHEHTGLDQTATQPTNGLWTKIYEKSLTVDTQTVSFLNIGTWRFIRVMLFGGRDTASDVHIRFNNDSNNHYHYNSSILEANAFKNTSVASVGLAAFGVIGRFENSVPSCTLDMLITCPSSTQYKSWVSRCHVIGGTTETGLASGEWHDSNSSINRIDFDDFSGGGAKFKSGSVFIIEGYK